MPNELTAFGRRMEQITDSGSLKRMAVAGGMAAKKEALDAATRDLGGDRSFSNFRRKIPLNAGFDTIAGDSTIQVNYRPAGLWKLADKGRRTQGVIRPRSRGGFVAVMTPEGPRASSRYSTSRGLGTFDNAQDNARREVPKAAFRQMQTEIGKMVR